MEWVIRYTDAIRAGRPALFLDRDGTIIENRPYINNPDDVNLIPGAVDAIRRFHLAGYSVIVVTNQSGIARGLSSRAQYLAVEERVNELTGPGLIDAVYACPFHPAGLNSFAIEHEWRKPSSGMLRAAQRDFEIDVGKSIMVGDCWSDIQAGIGADVAELVHVLTGHGAEQRALVQSGFAAQRAQGRNLPKLTLLASIADMRVEQKDHDGPSA